MSYRQSVHWIKPLVVLAISALILCISQKPGAGADNVRVAYSSPTATQGILWVADVGGLFKKNGLDVQVIYTRLAIESLVAGEIDFGQMTGALMSSARLHGLVGAYDGSRARSNFRATRRARCAATAIAIRRRVELCKEVHYMVMRER